MDIAQNTEWKSVDGLDNVIITCVSKNKGYITHVSFCGVNDGVEESMSIGQFLLSYDSIASLAPIEADTNWIDRVNGSKITIVSIGAVTLNYDRHDGKIKHRHIAQISGFRNSFKPDFGGEL